MEKAIEIFELIREIPYKICLNINEEDFSCFGKSYLLYYLLKGYGYNVRFRVSKFKWGENVPKRYFSLIKNNIGYHPYVEILINNEWLILDCTFDSKLGFEYNKWNGFYNTKICLKYFEILDPEVSFDIMKDYKSFKPYVEDLELNQEFYKVLNSKYLEKRKFFSGK